MITARINLLSLAGVAKPNPKMGQALGPLGINMMMFCKDFNSKTAKFETEIPLRIVLHGECIIRLERVSIIYKRDNKISRDI